MRVKQAADYLGVTPGSIRNWANDGSLPHTYNGAGQRVFTTHDLDNYKRARMGLEPVAEEPVPLFYARTSGSSDATVDNQVEKLTLAYGDPAKVFTDKGSGLNDNLPGLKKLFSHITEKPGNYVVYITNKDRLTRFGFNYLEYFFGKNNTTIEVLDDDSTKEPTEVLMQDFMSLLASFSGKFYAMRGWAQQRRFLDDVTTEVNRHAE